MGYGSFCYTESLLERKTLWITKCDTGSMRLYLECILHRWGAYTWGTYVIIVYHTGGCNNRFTVFSWPTKIKISTTLLFSQIKYCNHMIHWVNIDMSREHVHVEHVYRAGLVNIETYLKWMRITHEVHSWGTNIASMRYIQDYILQLNLCQRRHRAK
jgi:hypothetical protein